MFKVERDTEITLELVSEFIEKHRTTHHEYNELYNMYIGNHEILNRDDKEQFKPDNRLVVNYAKYIVDVLNGFFMGIPIKYTHDNQEIDEYLQLVDRMNNQGDNDAELSKLCSIYGHAYEMIFVDEDGDIGLTYIKPQEAFVIYDNSIVGKPRGGVRYIEGVDGVLEGSFSDEDSIIYFKENDEGTLVEVGSQPHLFGDIPIYEYVENEEKIGAFESVITLINAYNKAISEKANDVDYFADAYLSILGELLDEDTLESLRDSRIINMAGGDADKVVVEFLDKPDADETQENLIDRLEKLIFQISMVMDINDENFGTQSGIALKYKLQSMENLSMTKERKYTSGLNRRYKMMAETGLTPIKGDEWAGIDYQFTRNYPANLLEESEIASNLMGVTSDETALGVLSVVSNTKDELQRKYDEQMGGMSNDYELLER